MVVGVSASAPEPDASAGYPDAAGQLLSAPVVVLPVAVKQAALVTAFAVAGRTTGSALSSALSRNGWLNSRVDVMGPARASVPTTGVRLATNSVATVRIADLLRLRAMTDIISLWVVSQGSMRWRSSSPIWSVVAR